MKLIRMLCNASHLTGLVGVGSMKVKKQISAAGPLIRESAVPGLCWEFLPQALFELENCGLDFQVEMLSTLHCD